MPKHAKTPDQSATEFFDAVSVAINGQIEDCVDNLREEILKVARNKRGSQALTEDSLTVPTLLLKDKLLKEFHKNMDKFELYCTRNIFSSPEEPAPKPSTDAPENEDSRDKMAEKFTEDFDQSSREVLDLRLKYMDAVKRQRKLAAECDRIRSTVEQIKSSTYNVRVAAQAFEQPNEMSIINTASKIAEQRVQLQELILKSEAAIQRVQLLSSTSAAPIEDMLEIRASDEDDILQILENLGDNP